MYRIIQSADVTLTVHTLLGQEVAALVREQQDPGTYSVFFEPHGLASGVYIYRLTTSGRAVAGKMVLMK